MENRFENQSFKTRENGTCIALSSPIMGCDCVTSGFAKIEDFTSKSWSKNRRIYLK